MIRVIAVSILLFATLYASEYAVIVGKNSALSKLSQKQLHDIFIMKRHYVSDSKVIPVNLPSSSEIRTIFEKKVLKTSREKLNSYWIKQHFQGIRPPVVQSSQSSMKLFVKNVDGAIGYIPNSELDSDIKVIFEF